MQTVVHLYGAYRYLNPSAKKQKPEAKVGGSKHKRAFVAIRADLPEQERK
jgi:hypothetical protein